MPMSDGERYACDRLPCPSWRNPNHLLAGAIALVLATARTAAGADTSPQKQAPSSGGLEEIVVTATRRAQTVQDIPYNISAVTGAELDIAGIKDLTSVARLIPGLQTADLGPRAASTNSTFIIRGLNTYDPSSSYVAPNLTVPLVSTYIDDVPLFTNLRMTDIQRVEVLRGPQGTLYGSGSVGGTVRLIHNPPSTDDTEIQISTSAENTEHAGKKSYSIDTVFNLPLSERVAWRMSASYENLAGFINANQAVVYGANSQPLLADPASPLTSNYVTGSLRDINSSSDWQVRESLLWKITDSVSAEIAYDHENQRANGFDAQTPGEPYTVSTQIPVQPIDRNVDLASVTITADAGFATLTSSSSWYENHYNDTFDNSGFSTYYYGHVGYYGGFPRPTVFNFDLADDRSYVQEFRLVSKDVGPFDWIGGVFFRDQEQSITDPETLPGFSAWSQLPGSSAAAAAYYGIPDTFGNFSNFIVQMHGALPSADQPIRDYAYNFSRSSTFREFATYGELSYKVTPPWQVTVGARVFWDHFWQDMDTVLPICGAVCSQSGTDPMGTNAASAAQSFHNQIFKFNTSYKIFTDTTAYLTVSQGYRHGGANALCATPKGTFLCYSDAAVAPLIPYKSDTAVNYEIGVKGFAFDRRLQYSTALFLIDWKNIQLETFSPITATTLILNGNTARSQGFEAEITAQLTDKMTMTIGYAYDDAKLTQNFIEGSFIGLSGNPLPAVSKNTASIAADFLQPLTGSFKGLRFHLDASYKSSFTNGLNDCSVASTGALQCPAPVTPSGTRVNYAVLDGYTLLNGSVSLLLSDRWEFRAYANNLTNTLGISAQSETFPTPINWSQNIERPRTIGIEARYQFSSHRR
jgi:iron complex outermembrane recepter protein